MACGAAGLAPLACAAITLAFDGAAEPPELVGATMTGGCVGAAELGRSLGGIGGAAGGALLGDDTGATEGALACPKGALEFTEDDAGPLDAIIADNAGAGASALDCELVAAADGDEALYAPAVEPAAVPCPLLLELEAITGP